MVESDSVSPTWLRAVMVETWQVKEEGNWFCLEDANVKVGKFVGELRKGSAKVGVSRNGLGVVSA